MINGVAVGTSSSPWQLNGSSTYYNGGNVGIGTSSPVANLDVVGYANFSRSSGGNVQQLDLTNTSPSASAGKGVNMAFGGGSVQIGELGSAWSDATALNSYMYISTRGAGTVAERLRIDQNGNVGIGTSLPSRNLGFTGQAAQTVGMERETTAAAAGNGLTINAGGAVLGGSNLNGGNLTFASGTPTGSGTSQIQFQVAQGTGPGTADAVLTPAVTIRPNPNYNGTIVNSQLGIGTTSPGDTLVVVGSANGSGAGHIVVQNALNMGLAFGGINMQNDTSVPLVMGMTSSSYSNGDGLLPANGFIDAQAPNGLTIQSSLTGANSVIRFATNGNALAHERMRIDSTGNVGIGTTTPNYKLDVAGTVNASALMINGVAVGTSSSPWQVSGANTYYNLGNVGIGTTTPSYPLDVNGVLRASSTSNSIFGTSAGGGGIQIGDAVLTKTFGNPLLFNTNISIGAGTVGAPGLLIQGGGVQGLTAQAVNTLGFITNSTEQMRLDSSGRLGIGTTTPNAILDVATTTSGQSAIIVPRDTAANRPPTGVNGMIRYNTNANALEAFANGAWSSLATGASGASQWTTSSPNIYYNLGNVGIGTTSPGAPLQVNYTNTATSGTISGFELTPTYNQASGNASNIDFLINRTETAVGSGLQYLMELQTNGSTVMFVNDQGTIWSNSGISSNSTVSGYKASFTPYASSSAALNAPAGPVLLGVNSWGTGVDNEYAMLQLDVENAAHDSQNAYIAAVANPGAGNYTPIIAIGQQTGASAYNERMRIDQNGNVGIGTTTPNAILDVATTTSGQSAIIVPRDTAANRPVGVNGMIRYNTNLAAVEAFANGTWTSLAGAGTGAYLPLTGGTMTGAILDANGTAAAPSYSFTASTGTGVYSSAANNVSLATAGSQRLNVDQMGNVTVSGDFGIGTTAPGYPLQVNGQAYFTNSVGIGGTPYAGGLTIDVNNSAQGWGSNLLVANSFVGTGGVGSGNGGVISIAHNRAGAGLLNNDIVGELMFTGNNASAQGKIVGDIWSQFTNVTAGSEAGNLQFATMNGGTLATQMILTPSGSVGIGTLTPNYKLDVAGTVNASALMINGVAVGTSSSPWQVNGTNTYYSSAMLGIGTTTPGATLTVIGTAAIGSNNTASNTNAIAMGNGTTASGTYSTAMGTATVASNYGSTAMGQLTTASGQMSTAIGVSTTAPAYDELVVGQWNVTGGETPGSWVTTDPLFVIGNGTGSGAKSNAMTVLKNGNVGIGTTTPLSILDVGSAASGQSAIIVPRDTAANRPPTGVNGMIRYNTNAAAFEGFTNGAWS